MVGSFVGESVGLVVGLAVVGLIVGLIVGDLNRISRKEEKARVKKRKGEKFEFIYEKVVSII